MDTRQLAAFCTVVERQQLLAGRRAPGRHPARRLAPGARAREAPRDAAARPLRPTRRTRPRPGLRLYRGAQRLLELEEQLLDEVASEGEGALDGRALDRRLDRPGRDRGARAAVRVPAAASRRPDRAPGARHADGRRPRRRAGARARDRRRGAAAPCRPLRADPPRRGDPDLPSRATRFAGRTVSVDELRAETLIQMQAGAGVRQVVEDELRRLGVKPRDLDARSSSACRSRCAARCRPATG